MRQMLQSEPLLHRFLYQYGTTKNRKTLLTLIVPAAFAGLALIILFLKIGTSDQAGNEYAGSAKVATSSLTPIGQFSMTPSPINLLASLHRNSWTG